MKNRFDQFVEEMHQREKGLTRELFQVMVQATPTLSVEHLTYQNPEGHITFVHQGRRYEVQVVEAGPAT